MRIRKRRTNGVWNKEGTERAKAISILAAIPILIIFLLVASNQPTASGASSGTNTVAPSQDSLTPQQLIAAASLPRPCKITPTNDSLALTVMATPKFAAAEGDVSYVFAYRYPITTTQSWMNGTTITFSGIQFVFVNFGEHVGYCGSMSGAQSVLVVNVPTDPSGALDVNGMQVHVVNGGPA
jgi:hypothetical protein